MVKRPPAKHAFDRSEDLPIGKRLLNAPEIFSPHHIALGMALLGLGILIAHAATYWPFFSDDALISLRYAHRMLEGCGLTFNDGEAVEGYSNLLWILVVAFVGVVQEDLVFSTRIVGFLSAAMTLAALMSIGKPREGWKFLRSQVIPLSVLVLSAPMAVWTIGGLEQPLVAVLLAWMVAAVIRTSFSEHSSWRNGIWLGVLGGLLCLTRPDSPLLLGGLIWGYLARFGIRRQTLALTFAWIGTTAVFLTGQLTFRAIYYGTLVPNTALAKLSFSLRHLGEGAAYVKGGFTLLAPLLPIILAPYIFARPLLESTRRALFYLIPITVWSSYLIVIGGDIFPAYRHFVPVVVLLAFVAGEGPRAWEPETKSRAVIFALATLVCFSAFWVRQSRDLEVARAKFELWEWDGKAIATLLGRGFAAEKPLFAVTAAGSLPYWSELPVVDMLGLTDGYLTRHRPNDFGDGALGHELGDGEYVLSRRPDLVMFCGPYGGSEPCFRSGREMFEMADFDDFELVIFRAHRSTNFRLDRRRQFAARLDLDPSRRRALNTMLERFQGKSFLSRVWVRTDSEKIGIKRSSDSIYLPAYLFSGAEAIVSTADPGDRLGITIRAGDSAERKVDLRAGHWRVESHRSMAPVRISASDALTKEILGSGIDVVELDVNQPRNVSFNVTTQGPDPAHLRALFLKLKNTDTNRRVGGR